MTLRQHSLCHVGPCRYPVGVIRTFQYPLRPTKRQAAVLECWLERCRQLYNAALEQRIDAWRKQRKSISWVEQFRELAALRAEDIDYRTVPSDVARSALRRLDRAFKAFFRRVKAGGEAPGFPRFKGRDRYSSFDIGRGTVRDDRVRVPLLGCVRFRKYRPLGGEIREAQIIRTVRGWKVSFACDIGEAPPKVAARNAVGIDLGVTSLAVLSTGEVIDNPRCLARGAAVLTEHQQALARKKRGSRARKKAKRLVARAHERIRDRRLDFARKTAKDLVSRFDVIVHEDLNIRGLASGRLAKSVNDAAWGLLLRCIELKAEEAGVHVIGVDPRGTSQECSQCGAIVRKELSEREHRCGACGTVLGRDHNAALNVLARGRRASPILGLVGLA